MTNTTNEGDWIEVQTKTFTKWINSKLALKGYKPIVDTFKDCSDGTVLVNLIHCITNIELKHNPNPNSRYQALENHHFIINFLKENNVPVVNIRPSDLVDQNIKLTLGMIWTIILRFGLRGLVEDNLNNKKALLAWCKAVTQPYKNVSIQDFSNSWKDGLAFNAIIHRFRPELIGNYEELVPENSKFNIEKAFNVAEKELSIPKLLDVEDLLDSIRPDEKSIYTYVSEYYNKFSNYENELQMKNKISELIRQLNWSIKSKNEYKSKAFEFIKMVEAFNEEENNFFNSAKEFLLKLKNRIEMTRILNTELIELRILKENIDLIHSIYQLKEFEVEDKIKINNLDKGIFMTKIGENNNCLLILQNLEKEVSFFKEAEKLIKFKDSLDTGTTKLIRRPNSLGSNSNNLTLESVNIPNQTIKGSELSIDTQLIKLNEYLEDSCEYLIEEKELIKQRIIFLMKCKNLIKKRETHLNKAESLYKEHDFNHRGKIHFNDFIKCLNILGCNISKAMDDKIFEETSFFTYEEYMAIINKLCIENTNAVQFSPLIVKPEDLCLERSECDEVVEDGKIDFNRIKEYFK